MGKIILITGGARSGKSSFAEKYVARCGKKIAYIATAQALDNEMRQRINKHRERRPASWHTIEAPFAAEKAIDACHDYDTILFDCLTVYLSNIICQPHLEKASNQNREQEIFTALHKLIKAAKKHEQTTVFVTNEVGSGIVPENELARQYRDAAGMCNQYTARQADEVYLAVAGIPVQLK
ncbi:bifunctional adenosylcobinamide kinase/adenosylcobinamide-phosphate guanylyltransferase [Pectinatus frisingensis]|uniref:bifunctional adenosylcobinamide kinase/adenosylcobinamide-phosphate guanylyltransferase n=1 Tax=Pectinatus frisingensis TaxID=865 RepID=UPI003D8045AB